VKPIAKTLIQRFGSISAILNADEKLLQEIKGIGAAAVHVLKLARAVGIAAAREEITGKNVLTSWRQVLDYCLLSMVNDQQEQMRLLYLDKKNGLILDELHQVGTIDQAPLYPREVIRRALELGASSLILVHNHPSGDPTPSPGDVGVTLKIQEVGRGVGVSVHDHLVIGKGSHVSLKSLGLI
jgi:DNA repair protein RadC